MMASSHGNSFLIENGPNIVGMDAINHERQHACLITRSTNDANAFNSGDSLSRISAQLMFMSRRLFPANAVQIVDGRAQTNLRRDGRSARLKLIRQLCIDRL